MDTDKNRFANPATLDLLTTSLKVQGLWPVPAHFEAASLLKFHEKVTKTCCIPPGTLVYLN